MPQPGISFFKPKYAYCPWSVPSQTSHQASNISRPFDKDVSFLLIYQTMSTCLTAAPTTLNGGLSMIDTILTKLDHPKFPKQKKTQIFFSAATKVAAGLSLTYRSVSIICPGNIRFCAQSTGSKILKVTLLNWYRHSSKIIHG